MLLWKVRKNFSLEYMCFKKCHICTKYSVSDSRNVTQICVSEQSNLGLFLPLFHKACQSFKWMKNA